MKHLHPSAFHGPLLLGLALTLLTGCTHETRERLWQTVDPAGYNHAHSASFSGMSYHHSSSTFNKPRDDAMRPVLDQ